MGLWRRLRNTLKPERLDPDIAEELDFHRAMLAREPHRNLGNITYWREETRSMNLWTWLETVLQDLRYGARDLLSNQGFSITATLSLALGIMAATAMYSVIYGVVIEPFPYKDIDNLVTIGIRTPGQRGFRMSYTIDEFDELTRRNTALEGIVASTISDVLWISKGEPQRLRGNHISHNAFDVMGVPALHGRTVTASEENPESMAVLSHRFWMRQFGGDPSILGTTLILNEHPRTIVGIMPPRFMFRGPDVYLPVHYRSGEPVEGVNTVEVTARRKAGVSDAQAVAALDPVFRDLAQRYPTRFPPQWRVDIIPFKETFPSGIREVLWVMFGAVGLLLLIACANVSNLLLARASSRQREVAMRAALGASRIRLFRQLLTESLLLGLTGGIAGVLFSWLGLKAIMAVVPVGVIPDESEVVLNVPVLAFSFIVCLATTLLFGFAPAIHIARGNLVDTLKEAARGSGGSRSMGLLRGALVVVELSLAIILLSGAGLSLRSLLLMHNAPQTAGVDHRLTLRVPLSQKRYPTPERRQAFFAQLLDRLNTTPGIEAAGLNSGMHPIWSWRSQVEVPASAVKDARPVNFNQVNPAYLRATGIPMKQGRFIDESDVASKRRVMIVNQAFARRYFPSESPLGKAVKIPQLSRPPLQLADPTFEIVGIAADAMPDFSTGEQRPEVYVPYSITAFADTLVVRTTGDPLAIAPVVRAAVYQLDSSQFVHDTATLESFMDRFIYSRGRFHLWLMGVFATLGLTLAIIGVYGLLSQIVAIHRREYGIRMAVGAGFGEIIRLVLRRGIRLMTFGLGFGVAVTLVLLHYFGSKLGVADPLDPAPLTGACLVLLAAGIAACLIPAFRAARTNPVLALRLE